MIGTVFFAPQHPAVNTHKKVVGVNDHVAIQIPLQHHVYKNTGAYKSRRVNKYVVFPRVNNAKYGKNCGNGF